MKWVVQARKKQRIKRPGEDLDAFKNVPPKAVTSNAIVDGSKVDECVVADVAVRDENWREQNYDQCQPGGDRGPFSSKHDSATQGTISNNCRRFRAICSSKC